MEVRVGVKKEKKGESNSWRRGLDKDEGEGKGIYGKGERVKGKVR